MTAWRSPAGRIGIVLILAAVTVGAVLFLFLRSDPGDGSQEPRMTNGRDGQVPEMQFSETRIVGRKEGERLFEFDIAAFDLQDADASKVDFRGLTSGTLFQDGEPWVNIKAGRGTWNKSTNDLELFEDVTVFSDGEALLSSESLFYDADKEILRSPNAVQLHAPGMDIQAATMEAHLAESKIVLKGMVIAQHENGTRISADELWYLVDEKRVQIVGPGEVELLVEGESTRRPVSE